MTLPAVPVLPAVTLLTLVVLAFALAPRRPLRALLGAVLAFAVLIVAWQRLPAVIRAGGPGGTGGADHIFAPGDEIDDGGAAADDFDAELAMYAQPRLLDQALARIAPQTPGKIDLYAIAFAGDGSQDVFRNEAEYAERLFSRRFGAAQRVLVLENDAATITSRPLATLTNLIWAIDGIAAKMDPDEDILLVYLTTHGSREHELLVDLDPLPLNQITPADLADALDSQPPLRWKVVVVNACYSGGFLDALRAPGTLAISSARADRTSFGCGDDSRITWFGKAWLIDALNGTTDLRAAFDVAKGLVARWEARDREEPSEPQIASAAPIEAQLAAWERTLEPRPRVPFVPVADAPVAIPEGRSARP
jgi:hypothetical protein